MTRSEEVLMLIRSILGDGAGVRALNADSELIGSIPELDSMAMVNLINSLEEHFGIQFDDDDMSADTFASVSTLTSLVEEKILIEPGFS